jgi:hypothetical protein
MHVCVSSMRVEHASVCPVEHAHASVCPASDHLPYPLPYLRWPRELFSPALQASTPSVLVRALSHAQTELMLDQLSHAQTERQHGSLFFGQFVLSLFFRSGAVSLLSLFFLSSFAPTVCEEGR